MNEVNNIFVNRRKAFISRLPQNTVAIIPNNSISFRSNDVEYRYRCDSDFYYLTGFDEPNSICVLKKDKKSFTYYLFVEGNDKEKEIWIGKRVGTEGAKTHFKADKSFLIKEFNDKIKKISSGVEYIFFPVGKNKELDITMITLINDSKRSNRAALRTPKMISDPRDIIHKMRLIKNEHEIDCIKNAIDVSQMAHISAMACVKAGMFEYEIESLIEYQFRVLGGIGPAYPSIVGSGKNSTILHYINNNKKIQEGELILIDAGCEYDYYVSDITRTFPAGKKFTPVQKDIYQIVLDAQIKAIDEMKPGKRFIDSYNKAVRVISEGLKELKLLKGSISEIIEREKYKKFFMHKLSHWLGLDVHDAGPYIDDDGSVIKLKSGMVLTVEPGIYISNNDMDVPAMFRGIGVRIEDDMLITKDGNKILTSGIPKSIQEIETIRSGI